MCGIAGIFNRRTAPPPDRQTLQRMIRVVRHRGPDEQGFYADEQVGLAHARLSIIDLAGGTQPVHNEDETVWVVFNGEIFNYIELRQELKARGHRFYTESDTEVLVHLYEEHGAAFVDRINGQFGIAIWDTKDRKLLLARDRVGIRPVFYAEVGDRLIFGSEIKSIFMAPGVERRLDLGGLGELMTFWAPLPPSTVFAGVKALPAGHVMVLEGGEKRIHRYWDWSFPAGAEAHDARPLPELAEELRALLVDAVRLRLRSDVPVGAYLSGGLDSSVITALVHNYTDAPLRTFSLTFEDEEFDERSYQRELVEHLETTHSEIACSRQTICELFPRMIWHAESPVLRTAPTPLLLLSSLVREKDYKVVLTGEGSDEVFAGYDIFREAKVRRLWSEDPDGEQPLSLLRRLYPYLKASPTANEVYARKFFSQGEEHIDEPYFGHIPRWLTTSRTWRFFSDEVKAELAGWDRYAAVERILPEGIRDWQPLCRDQYLEAHTLMTGYLLSSQGDRVMMGNSIEGRFPFLDHRVIAFACRLPVDAKIHDLEEKYLLKLSMSDLLPKSIVKRSKQPYRAPDSGSFIFDGEPADYVAEMLGADRIARAGIFNPKATDALVNKARKGRLIGFADNMAFVGILSTMLIDEMFIRPDTLADSFPSADPAQRCGAIANR